MKSKRRWEITILDEVIDELEEEAESKGISLDKLIDYITLKHLGYIDEAKQLLQ